MRVYSSARSLAPPRAFQGEGQHTGRNAVFVRLGGCNLHCTWCDTPYSWVWTDRQAAQHHGGKKYDPAYELKRMSVREVLHEIEKRSTHGCVVLTGGEPMLQYERWLPLVAQLWDLGHCVEVETAGTIAPTDGNLWTSAIRWNVSPKLEHSGNEKELRYKPEVLKKLNTFRTAFKFVVRESADLEEVAAITAEVDIRPQHVWIMAEGTTADGQLRSMRRLEQSVLDRGWNLTPRLHTLLWDDQRGK